MSGFFFLLVCCCSSFIASSSAESTAVCSSYVSHGGTDQPLCGNSTLPCATIQQAVLLAQGGDTICVRAGTVPYNCPTSLVGVVVNKPLSIVSVNGKAVIDCEGKGRHFSLSGGRGVTIAGFEMRNGGSPSGGAINSNGTVDASIVNCSFVGNSAPNDGGAITSSGDANLRISDCSFVANFAAIQGGAVMVRSNTNFTISFCMFSNNTVSSAGGTIVGGALRVATSIGTNIRNCTFYNNIVTSNADNEAGGGAVAIYKCVDQVVAGCLFVNNTSSWAGGAIFLDYSQNVRVTNCTFLNNLAQSTVNTPEGGAVAMFNTAANIENCNFTKNTASSPANAAAAYGGAVSFFQMAASSGILNCTFTQNWSTWDGGAVSVQGSNETQIGSCTFINNSAVFQGGAVYAQDDIDLRIEACYCMHNRVENLGGCVALIYNNQGTNGNTFEFRNNSVTANFALFGGGIAIAYQLSVTKAFANNVHHFIGGSFVNNTAQFAGGAAYIVLPPDAPTGREDYPWDHTDRRWIYKQNQNSFDGVSFIGNRADCVTCLGGALDLNSGHSLIAGCHFEKNWAGLMGGAILVSTDSTAALVVNTSFSHNHARDGGDLYSSAAGQLSVADSTFESFKLMDSVPFVNVPQGGDVALTRPNVRCLPGNRFVNSTLPLYWIYEAQWGLVPTTTYTLSCVPCTAGTYLLAGANVTSGMVEDFSCSECPGFADCSKGGADVFTLPGYWCGRNPERWYLLECTICPENYCWGDARPWDQGCRGKRQGVLCGECAEGYSLAFGSTECVPEQNCWAGGWFIPTVCGVGLVYLLVLVWLPIAHHPLWKSITYFMQALPLVAGVDNAVISAAVAAFALDPGILGFHVSICPWPKLTPVQKMASGYLIPVILLVELALMYGIHHVLHPFLRNWWQYIHLLLRHLSNRTDIQEEEEEKEEEEEEEDEEIRAEGDEQIEPLLSRASREAPETIPLHPRYAAACTGVVLLMYEGVTASTMDLLNCIPFGDQLRLFLAGGVTCYAGWQVPLFVLLVVFLVPFPLMLILGRHLIRRKRWHTFPTVHAILGVLERPYTEGRQWWESVGMLRRLVLVTLAVFILNPLWKAVSLFVVCSATLVSHIYLKPFANASYGLTESAFLYTLTLISALQLPLADHYFMGVAFEGATAEAIKYLQLGLMLVPLCCCVLAIFIVYGRRWLPRNFWPRSTDLPGPALRSLISPASWKLRRAVSSEQRKRRNAPSEEVEAHS